MLDSATVRATIAVSDLDRAKQFYGETLGLAMSEERGDGVRYRTGGGSEILVYHSSFAGTNKATYMGFDVPDLEAAVEELRGAGITFEQYDFPELKTDERGIAETQGIRGAWFKDPDGNILAIGERT
jgi:catechol 2,3-dioxygenase-like lactoylglutathione lyase family enzyme